MAEEKNQIKAQSLPDASLFPELVPQTKTPDPMVLWGAWLGDEPIEELLAQLSSPLQVADQPITKQP